MEKDEIIANCMQYSTKLLKREYGVQAQVKGLHYEYRQGAMDAAIQILMSVKDHMNETTFEELVKGLLNEPNPS